MKDLIIYHKDTRKVISLIPEVEERERDIVLVNDLDYIFVDDYISNLICDDATGEITVARKTIDNIVDINDYKKIR